LSGTDFYIGTNTFPLRGPVNYRDSIVRQLDDLVSGTLKAVSNGRRGAMIREAQGVGARVFVQRTVPDSLSASGRFTCEIYSKI